MNPIHSALALAEQHSARSIERLRQLIAIPSLTGEEGLAQQPIAEWLRAIGAAVHVQEPDVAAMFEAFPDVAQYPTHWQHDLILPYADLPRQADLEASGLDTVLNYRGRPNVVGVLSGTGGGRSLILNGHIDTVTIEPSREWTQDPFGAAIVDGKLYGRGASDMKGGLVAALMALTYLREAGVRLAGDVIFQSVVNEEHAGNGTLDLVRQGYRADAAIVLEPTNNQVFVSHPGGLYWQVDVDGNPRSPGARWAGRTMEGVSAIEKIPPVIDALLALETRYNAAARGAAVPFSLVIGKILGGHYETVTASSVQMRGGAYFQPEVGSVIDVMDHMRRAVAASGEPDAFLCRHPARLQFLHHDDSTLQDPDIEVARHLGAVLRRSGALGDAGTAPFACDMRHLVNQGGIPSVIFGPGSIAQAHRPDEHIPVAEFLAAIQYLIRFIPEWCGVANDDTPRDPRA